MAGQPIAFGPFVLNPEAGTLLRLGVPVPVGYRGLLLLAALVARPGEVLAKSELMDAAWPGTAVEEGNLTVQIASLRKLLGPSEGGSEWIATIPRVGYRFAGTIAKAETVTAAAGQSPLAGPSLAVLAFASLSDDPEQAYFADGLAEDIITRLSRLRWLFVSARNSSFTYKGKAVDVKQVGRDLGVHYVLDGSVRRSGQRLRIGAELSEAATGLQVWAERYDVELADFFALQDQIAESVIAAIEPRLYVAEHQRFRSRSPESLDAWGFVMKAMPYVWTWGSADDIATAEALLRRATAIDPDYPRANSLLAWAHAARVQLGWADAADVLPAARAAAQRAIQRDAEDPWAHFAAGYVHMVARGFADSVRELSEAIALNPSLAFAHMILGSTYGYGGMPEDGLHHLAIATRLSPRDFTQAGNLATQGLCHFMAERYGRAVALEREAVGLRPHFGTAWRTLAASAGMAGEREIAARALGRGAAPAPVPLARLGRDLAPDRPRPRSRPLHRRPSRRRTDIGASAPAPSRRRSLAGVRRSDPQARPGKGRQVVGEFRLERRRYPVGLANRRRRVDADIGLGDQPVSEPADTDVVDPADARDVPRGVTDLAHEVRVGAVEHPGEDRLSRLPDDPENRDRDQQPDEWIGKRETEPHTDRPEHHREARQSVDAGVIAVGDERGAVDLAPDPDAEDGDRLVAGEAGDARRRHPAEMRDRLRMDQPVDRLPAGDEGAEEDDADDGGACEILDPAHAMGEAEARLPSGEDEGDPQRNRGGRVADIVDRVGEQRHAPGELDDDDLQDRGRQQQDERPLDGPDAPRRRGDRRVERAVRMAVTGVAAMAVTAVMRFRPPTEPRQSLSEHCFRARRPIRGTSRFP